MLFFSIKLKFQLELHLFSDSGYLGNSLEDLQYYESSPEDLQLIERTLEEMEFSSCWEQTEDGKSLLFDSYYCNFGLYFL